MADVILARARTKTRLTYGIGINDAVYAASAGSDLERTLRIWRDMLYRCYSIKFQIRCPTYTGCSVCDEWLRYSNFESWLLEQNYVGLQLDKDLLFPGNKIYSPQYCVFVSHRINCLITESCAARGALPLGVTTCTAGAGYVAQCNVRGVQAYLGYFATPQLAHAAWQATKAKVVDEAALEVSDPRAKAALTLRADRLRDDLANNRETISLNSAIF